ncbi:Retrovirus Pol polyprotein from type-1 retrotransposable element R2 [Paragonimus skrjabini miyazakii]|uniref:Retrovirus Pol polyprotein from type-1 retrotransposable element R2 n=1 Tax=Paragonimus skrjabini miyazakii TaxID=59628 RepID=A0A8S9YPB0_9TREM|nr:Retrovirus Pol polyprotein from type-1 retrotransposable element R2 [Paragonimus skrjabini miyazakii]
MKLNNSKCGSITILKDGTRKHLVLFPQEYEIDNGVVPYVEVDGIVRYLGLNFDWKGRLLVESTKKVMDMLESVTKAPLKSCQRLEILKTFLIPKLKFELIVDNAHRNTLRKIDHLIHGKVRALLRLPKDTMLAFMRTKVDDHGLGIPTLETAIPLEQRSKFERLLNSDTPEIINMVECKAVLSDVAVANFSILVQSKPVCWKLKEDTAWRETLVKSCDGADFANACVDKASHHWFRNPRYVFPHLSIRGLQLRGGLLNIKVRSSRGGRRVIDDLRCRGLCGCPESIEHILQWCALTHDARCSRHNRVVQKVGKLFSALGDKALLEPVILTGITFCKPNLVV